MVGHNHRWGSLIFTIENSNKKIRLLTVLLQILNIGKDLGEGGGMSDIISGLRGMQVSFTPNFRLITQLLQIFELRHDVMNYEQDQSLIKW